MDTYWTIALKKVFFNNFNNSSDYQLGHKQPMNESSRQDKGSAEQIWRTWLSLQNTKPM